MTDAVTSQDDRRRENLLLSRTSFGLFVGGLLVPFVIAAVGRDDVAFGFGLTAELLALLLGLLSWRERLSKIVAATLLILVGLGGVATGVYVAMGEWHAQLRAAEQRARAHAERLEARHKADVMRAKAEREKALRRAEATEAAAAGHGHGHGHDQGHHDHSHDSQAHSEGASH